MLLKVAMPAACLPANERERLAALASYQILDTPAEPAFDDITRLVAHICEAPFAVVSLVGEDRQFFKSEVGLGMRGTPIATSICAHALLQRDLFVVPDLAADPRFADNPLVIAHPGLRFYAGQLLTTDDGYDLGTLCVLDTRPRELTAIQRDALKILARHVMSLLELRRITERDRRLLAEQAELNSRLDAALSGQHRISAMVAHDLRSPLSVVSLGVEMIKSSATDPTLIAVTERMDRAVSSMQALIDDLLDLEQSNADTLRIEPTHMSSGELVRGALDTLAPLADAAGVELISIMDREVDLRVDPRRIQQVLGNLIGNALKVSSRGSEITVGVTDEASHVRIWVRDRGPGLAPEDQLRVFEPFFTKRTTAKSAGLGLTISKRIIDASGGTMGVDTPPQGGARFWFTLPVAHGPAARV